MGVGGGLVADGSGDGVGAGTSVGVGVLVGSPIVLVGSTSSSGEAAPSVAVP